MPTHFVGLRNRYKKGLPMFVGRDTYGLGQDKVPLVTDYEYDELDWLKSRDGYYYDDSPFWRVIGHVLERVRERLYGPDIFHDFYWSDLYKINFRAKQGTTQGLRSEQVNESGNGVGRFFERWVPRGQLKSKNESTGEFTLVGESGKMHRCIVVPHPQGKVQEDIIQNICSMWKQM